MPDRALLVFSHLRWNFVYQRPQHLLARLGRHFQVFYVEEPVHDEGARHLEVIETVPDNVEGEGRSEPVHGHVHGP